MKLGIIGKGNIGGTLETLLGKAGHEIRFGNRAEPGSVAAAVKHGEIVIFAGYFGRWPDFAWAHGADLVGKVVIDAANPYGDRDGAIVAEVAGSKLGSGAFVARLLPGAHTAKAFNTLYWIELRDRPATGIALPVAADDPAGEITGNLVRDSGYEPVVYPLRMSALQDPDARLYGKAMAADEIRLAIDLANGAPGQAASR